MSIKHGKRNIVIGDIHGCVDELEELLDVVDAAHHDNVISLGDVTDKGPDAIGVIKLLRAVGASLVVGNHDDRYIKFFQKEERPDVSEVREDAQEQFEALLNNPREYEWLVDNAEAFHQLRLQNGQLFTFVHGGVSPHSDIYSYDYPFKRSKDFNRFLRTRYLNPKTGRFVAMKKVEPEGKYPDEFVQWVPVENSVVPWQSMYDGRYGTILHGHIICGKHPQVWYTDEFNASDPITYGGSGTYLFNTRTIKAISMDTGAHKGQYLTAAIINEDGSIEFENVRAKKVYMP